MGPGCREFESRHSDQISRNGFMPFLLISFGGARLEASKCNADERCRRQLDGGEPLSAPISADANESPRSGPNRQFSVRKLVIHHNLVYQNLEMSPSRILYVARTCSSDIFPVRIRYISFLRSYKKTCKAFSALSNVKEYSSIKQK